MNQIELLTQRIQRYQQIISPSSYSYQIQEIVYQPVSPISNYCYQQLVDLIQKKPESPVSQQFLKLLQQNAFLKPSDLYDFIHCHPNIQDVLNLLNQNRLPLDQSKQFQVQVLNSLFVPVNIKDFILQFYCHHYQIKFKVNQIPVNLNIWLRRPVSNQQRLNNIVAQIGLCLAIITITYRVKRWDSPVNINYFPTQFKKILKSFNWSKPLEKVLKREAVTLIHQGYQYNPEQIDKTISINHVNSGFCAKSWNQQYITIWRKEEMPKVLLHELIHYFNLEKVELPNLVHRFNINVSNRFPAPADETITECQTWFLSLLFQSINHRLNPVQIVELIYTEQQHAFNKIIQILRHFEIGHLSEFWESQRDDKVCNLNCSLVYYYIIKGLIVIKLDPTALKLLLPDEKIESNQVVQLIQSRIREYQPLINQSLNYYYGGDYTKVSNATISNVHSLTMMKGI